MEQNNIVTKENITVNDFERICRTCLSTVGLHLISDAYNLGYFLVEFALNKYTQVKFDSSDSLPKLICSNCVSSLNNCYQFLNNCDLVNTTLKECLARYESSLYTNICLPNEIEYVNCHIKQEREINDYSVDIKEEDENDSDNCKYSNGEKLKRKLKRIDIKQEFDSSELEVKTDDTVIPPHLKIEELHTTVDIKVDDLEDEYDNDPDEEQILTNVKHKITSEKESSLRSRLIPEMSKEKYEAAYNLFMNWHRTQNHKSFSQNVLLVYFQELSKKFKASTLLTQYSMLRMTLIEYKDVDIAGYVKLRDFLKGKSHGHRPKKSKIFNREEIDRFIKEAPDFQYLLTKVVLIMGVSGACRLEELYKIKLMDLEDLGSAFLVKIKKLKASREFTITGHFYEVVKKYVDLRPKEQKSYFFVHYRKGKCSGTQVSTKKFAAKGKKIATYLKLPNPELYTGHCFRRSSLEA